MFSLPVGRMLLAAALVLTVIETYQKRRWPEMPLVVWMAGLFLAVLWVTTLFGVNPELGVPKLRKLVWFVAIPVTAVQITTRQRLQSLLRAIAAGATVQAASNLIFRPISAFRKIEIGRVNDFVTGLIDSGSMTDGQRLMVGVIIGLGFLLIARATGRTGAAWALLGVQVAGLVINFKRGSWFCALVIAVVLLALNKRWRYLAGMAIFVGICLALPPVQQRVKGLAREFTNPDSSRRVMWTKIAPALIKQHPWGIGYRSLTNAMMKQISPAVERGRDHLHSNLAQVLVEAGWLGFALYLAWMAVSIKDAGTYARRSRNRPPAERITAQVLLLALLGLMGNGLVEYNLGDAEIVLIYCFLMGAAAAMARLREESALPQPGTNTAGPVSQS